MGVRARSKMLLRATTELPALLFACRYLAGAGDGGTGLKAKNARLRPGEGKPGSRLHR